MNENKRCGNCKNGGEMSANMYGWRHCHLTIAQVPIGNDFHTHRDDCPCPQWEEKPKEITEYRTGNGPFWADKSEGSWWTVFCHHETENKWWRVFGGVNESVARIEVDRLNSACRGWSESRHQPQHRHHCVSCLYLARGCRKKDDRCTVPREIDWCGCNRWEPKE